MRYRPLALLACLLTALPCYADEAFGFPFGHQVPLEATTSGSYTIRAQLGTVDGEFLLDTGASMISVNRGYFDEIRNASDVTLVREVAARMASGKLEVMKVYRVSQFSLGTCDLGEVEIAVMKRGGRNLLGMNALTRAAPFAVYTSPPALGLSQCGSVGSVAAR